MSSETNLEEKVRKLTEKKVILKRKVDGFNRTYQLLKEQGKLDSVLKSIIIQFDIKNDKFLISYTNSDQELIKEKGNISKNMAGRTKKALMQLIGELQVVMGKYMDESPVCYVSIGMVHSLMQSLLEIEEAYAEFYNERESLTKM